MSPLRTNKPRIGIPWSTSEDEAKGLRPTNYESAVREAGGEPVVLPLSAPDALRSQLGELQGFVLPGSGADVDPKEYGTVNQGKSQPADLARERTDRAILDHAFAEGKPVLAICYGCQLLNVYLGGTLIQDLKTATGTKVAHRKTDMPVLKRKKDPEHPVQFEPQSKLAQLAGKTDAKINSSHHQSIEKPGKDLKVTGVANDGIVESVEWTGRGNWVVGVQWHPERMDGDPLAKKLFEDFLKAAQTTRRVGAEKA